MSEYTPTIAQIRDLFHLGALQMPDVDVDETLAMFDRFIDVIATAAPEQPSARWVADVQAAAWDEGAKWAAVECAAINTEENFWLAPADNPYRTDAELLRRLATVAKSGRPLFNPDGTRDWYEEETDEGKSA